MQGYKLKTDIKDIKVNLSVVKNRIKDMDVRYYFNTTNNISII